MWPWWTPTNNLKRISGSQSLEISVLWFLHLIIICIFIFFHFIFIIFSSKKWSSFFFILVCSFGCWCFCYSVGGSLLVLFFLQSFSFCFLHTWGWRGGEGRGGRGGGGGEGRGGESRKRGGEEEGGEEEGRGEGTQLGSFQATWLDPGPCKNFQKIGKLQFSSSFFYFLIIF